MIVGLLVAFVGGIALGVLTAISSGTEAIALIGVWLVATVAGALFTIGLIAKGVQVGIRHSR
jgi:hypothetical protein